MSLPSLRNACTVAAEEGVVTDSTGWVYWRFWTKENGPSQTRRPLRRQERGRGRGAMKNSVTCRPVRRSRNQTESDGQVPLRATRRRGQRLLGGDTRPRNGGRGQRRRYAIGRRQPWKKGVHWSPAPAAATGPTGRAKLGSANRLLGARHWLRPSNDARFDQ